MKLAVLAVLSCLGQSPAPAPTQTVDYARDVQPLLANTCTACHGALRQKAQLRLDTAAGILAGGASGPAIVPGHADESLLIGAITGQAGFQMPPAGEGTPLNPEQVAVLRRWIEQGAAHPDQEATNDPARHWAYQAPQRPAVPTIAGGGSRHPIDAFLGQELQAAGIQPAKPADKATLLRRVSIDLIGLAPTREELQEFLADGRPDAYERVVDRLLASPRHAERWGRHWMDVWRYSDWYGKRDINQHRNSRQHIWRWRDWIIESLVADKPYDQMILEMLAGDELAPSDEEVLRATGYLGRNYYVYNRHVWLQDTVEYTGMALLGLTFKCCRCHDHKYDPISQEEYYRFRAIFEPHNVRLDRLPGQPETMRVTNAAGSAQEEILKQGLERVFDADPSAPTYLLVRGNEKNPQTERPLAPGVPAVLGGTFTAQPVPLPASYYYPSLRAFVEQEDLGAAETRIVAAQAAADLAAQALASAQQAKPAADAGTATAESTVAGAAAGQTELLELADTAARASLAAARTAREALVARYTAERAKHTPGMPEGEATALAATAAQAEREATLHGVAQAFATARHDQARSRQELAAGDAAAEARLKTADAAILVAETKLAELNASQAPAAHSPVGSIYPAQSTGRRLALARWIVDRQNPLTARVAVNHIWLRHVGSPLVATVENFGLRGALPTHPALLDWLAVEFMEQGWSMKHLHRLIVTSEVYRRQSAGGPSLTVAEAVDPENRLLWRANPRKLEAEAIRDSLLQLSGTLDPAMGGPDIDPAEADTNPRRSVYFRHTPDDKPALLEVFDAANAVECYRRVDSVIPQQALVLANGALSLDSARRIAARLTANASDAEFIDAAFQHVLTRDPTDAERKSCANFLSEQTMLLQDPARLHPIAGDPVGKVPAAESPAARAREGLIHVLLNHHDFVYLH